MPPFSDKGESRVGREGFASSLRRFVGSLGIALRLSCIAKAPGAAAVWLEEVLKVAGCRSGIALDLRQPIVLSGPAPVVAVVVAEAVRARYDRSF